MTLPFYIGSSWLGLLFYIGLAAVGWYAIGDCRFNLGSIVGFNCRFTLTIIHYGSRDVFRFMWKIDDFIDRHSQHRAPHRGVVCGIRRLLYGVTCIWGFPIGWGFDRCVEAIIYIPALFWSAELRSCLAGHSGDI